MRFLVVCLFFGIGVTELSANTGLTTMPVIQAIFRAKEICDKPLLEKVQSYRSKLNERLKIDAPAQKLISQSAFDSLELQLKCGAQIKELEEKNKSLALKELALNRQMTEYQKAAKDLTSATSQNTLSLTSSSSAALEKSISEVNQIIREIQQMVGDFKTEEENSGFIKEYLHQRKKFYESAKVLGSAPAANQKSDSLRNLAIADANGVLSEAVNYARALIELSRKVKKQIADLENASKALGSHSTTSGDAAKGLGGP